MFARVFKVFEKEKDFLRKAGWIVSNTLSYKWWGGLEDPREIIVSAILVQMSKWESVTKVLGNLRREKLIDFQKLSRLRVDELEKLLRPLGFRRVKAERIIELSRRIVEAGGLNKLRELNVDALRSSLTSVKGIGFETADSIILYALNKPTIPISKYVRRVLKRLGIIEDNESYETIRKLLLRSLKDTYSLKLFYAGLTAIAKLTCKPKQNCSKCILKNLCRNNIL